MNYTILIVEDEAKIAEVVRDYLQKDGYRVEITENGEQAVNRVLRGGIDLVLLDLMLPGMSGEEVCKRIRACSTVPVIMMTAKTAESDRIEGLSLGADDYVPKPFSPRELVARVKAVLRRTSDHELLADRIYLPGGIMVDDVSKQVFKHGEVVPLTPTEYKILALLARHPRRTFSRSDLVERILGFDYEGEERVIDTHVKNLRRKIEDDPKNPQIVVSVYGHGYRLGG
ncbi:response regulator transcription factor [Effusibacillus lacus]|uniref:DNA-binding response regulator n=1 Tax=Effusibacillus lacus TaxID=1348429 RepID=A0A292YHC4_9BACL|nr:response regulator transcription factor [Effusibacillus lacus]TCS72317.1 DNA-binding response OmpR family regulator [Effusibacillus lacus]GAX90217.1 DNA-binding response regulator [Effusibacillus lacus]